MIKAFSDGLFAIIRAWIFIYRNPGLLRYAIAPLIINVVVFSVMLYFGSEYLFHLVDTYLVYGDAWWWKALEWIAQALAFALMLVIGFFTFTAVGNLIAAPFNDILSEKTEYLLRGSMEDEPFSIRLMLKDAGRSLSDEIKKLSIFLGVMLLLLLIGFIPVVGPPAFGICSVLLTLYFLVVEYTGFVCSRKHIGFKQQRTFIRAHRSQSLGFGIAVMLTLMLPLIQFLTIPLAVVAATHFCVNHMDETLLHQGKHEHEIKESVRS